MAKTWSGRTAEAGTIILGAPFWKQGTELAGIYIRSFTTGVGNCDEFLLVSPKELTTKVNEQNRIAKDGEASKEVKITSFAMGALTGYEMAIQALMHKGFDGKFQYKDAVIIKCTGIDPAQGPGMSDMPMFEITITRPEAY